MTFKPALAITLGDAAGIGPEVVLKALSRWKNRHRAKVLLIGRASFFSALSARLGLHLRFSENLESPSGSIACYFPGEFPSKLVYGRSDNAWTRQTVRSIELAVKLAMEGAVDGIVTPPINKAGLKKAGFTMPGHTEYLAELSGTKKYEMMLVGGPLRVVLVTRHVAIADVPKKLSRSRVMDAIRMADRELRSSFGIKRPRIVVCGLNPHAGESGSFGREEIDIIAPAVRAARASVKSELTGPLSSDALFHDAYRGRYDAVVCMYHDQGLIPLKMISRGGGVNLTLGLPFVRTSPDHGTAYDIAGKFRADSGSMEEALELAFELCRHRRRPAYRQAGPA